MSNYDIQLAIQDAGYNVVTCGECGSVQYHRVKAQEITCEDCKYSSEPCDFPDLYY